MNRMCVYFREEAALILPFASGWSKRLNGCLQLVVCEANEQCRDTRSSLMPVGRTMNVPATRRTHQPHPNCTRTAFKLLLKSRWLASLLSGWLVISLASWVDLENRSTDQQEQNAILTILKHLKDFHRFFVSDFPNLNNNRLTEHTILTSVWI